jgi:hypothetical protein
MKEHPVKRIVASIGLMILIAALAGSPVAVAQEKPAPVPLKVQLVVSRYAADKKISSLPYTLWVTANDRNSKTTSVRMGVQVPIVTTIVNDKTGQSFSVIPVSRCRHEHRLQCHESGRWHLQSRRQVERLLGELRHEGSRADAEGGSGVPEFTSNFSILLKDGQTAQYASATDPVSGETLKVDVTAQRPEVIWKSGECGNLEISTFPDSQISKFQI